MDDVIRPVVTFDAMSIVDPSEKDFGDQAYPVEDDAGNEVMAGPVGSPVRRKCDQKPRAVQRRLLRRA